MKITVDISGKLEDAIERRVEDCGFSRSAIIRESLLEFFAKRSELQEVKTE